MIEANTMRELAQIIEKKIGGRQEFGFALFVFPFNSPGISNYISNATRETMIKALMEKLEIFIEGGDFQTPESN